ncbi:MAG TPA: PIN domain-containing protein [Blastocatellia bacterium]|nr:PIN domain-containing protein [Blastocatellia bacterium]
MRYLFDSNVLRSFAFNHPTLLRNMLKVDSSQIALPFIVKAEQMRGRYDAITKAAPQRLLQEQERLVEAETLLAGFEIAYLTDDAFNALNHLMMRKQTRKRYADAIIAAIAIANHDIVITRNVEDFKDLLPASQLQN